MCRFCFFNSFRQSPILRLIHDLWLSRATMVSDWLADAVAIYNDESHNRRDEYVAQVHFPAKILEDILDWAFKALPDEILVGLDVSSNRNCQVEVEFQGNNQRKNLFAGQGYRIHEAKMVNRGDSFSVSSSARGMDRRSIRQ